MSPISEFLGVSVNLKASWSRLSMTLANSSSNQFFCIHKGSFWAFFYFLTQFTKIFEKEKNFFELSSFFYVVIKTCKLVIFISPRG